MYKWFLASRYLYTKMIAFFGVASVMLCVAMVLVVLSVTGGFLDTVRERARGLHSEIVLEAGTLQGMPYYEEFGDYLKRTLPDLVTTTTPVIYSYSIFRVPATTCASTTPSSSPVASTSTTRRTPTASSGCGICIRS